MNYEVINVNWDLKKKHQTKCNQMQIQLIIV